MLYAIKLKSGEALLAELSYRSEAAAADRVVLTKPLSASVINGQLVTIPWPEFCANTPVTIDIDADLIVYSALADEQVKEQYEKVIAMVHKN